MRTYDYDDEEEIETDEEEEPEDDDEESEEEDEEYDDDDGDESADEDEAEEDEELLARVEKAFRSERARIRDCDSLVELRGIRASYQDQSSSLPHVAQRIRARDLVELADVRITSLKAERFARRSR